MKNYKLSLRAKGLAVYLFLLLGLALFGHLGYQNLNRVILWVGGPLLAFWILLPKLNILKELPYEYWAYLSLFFFGFLGFFQVIDVDGFLRYQQVLAANFVLMILIYFGIDNENEWILVWKTIYSVGLFVAVQSYVSGGFAADAEYQRLAGLAGNANGTANYARISIIAALLLLQIKTHRVWRYLFIISIVFLSYVILITASRGNFVNLIFILAAFLILRYFKGWHFIMFLIFFLIFSNLVAIWAESFLRDFYLYERLTKFGGVEETVEGDYRFVLLAKAWDLFLKNPVFGVGLNQFRIHSGGMISHTDLLDILVQLGIIAGVIYGSIYVCLFKRLNLLRRFYTGTLNKISYILFICIFSECLYGLSNPNWFSQLQMVILSLIVVGCAKIFSPLRFGFR